MILFIVVQLVWNMLSVIYKKVDEIDHIDILLIGINLANWVGTSKKIINIYYQHFEWISEICKKISKFKHFN